MSPETNSRDTFFAPAGRQGDLDLRSQAEICVNSPIAQAVLESLDGFVAVLNSHRQILAANKTLLGALAREGLKDPLGMRWGEAAACVHASEGPDGCGTSRACRYCGAVLGILAAQKGPEPVTGECRMSIRRHSQWEAREFEVRITRLTLPFGDVVIPVFHDISDRHRREILESAFLHDLSNTLTALSCWTGLMQEGAADPGEATSRIADISSQLTDVVAHQRLLIQAEQGKLVLDVREVDAEGLLASLRRTLACHPLALGRAVTLALNVPPGARVRTDPVLLLRILSNMGINAIEASHPGAVITFGLAFPEGRPRFRVHNPGFIPDAVAQQIFQRSFSTKAGPGRGLGTYSMKLLGENHLGASVGFHTSASEGTEFFLVL